MPGKSAMPKVAVINFGDTVNITRHLIEIGCIARIFLMRDLKEVTAWNADGILLSDGPGNPNKVFLYAAEFLNAIKDSGIPVFGMGLSHHLMALAAGFPVKMKQLKNRGIKQPIKNLISQQVKMIYQHYAFSVNQNGSEETGARITHLNINDNSIEGLWFKNYCGFSFQYHPNLLPDNFDFLFRYYIDLLKILSTKKQRMLNY